jgi:hypothetical protein
MLFIRGTLVHTPERGEVQLLEDRFVVVTDEGVIAAIAPGANEAEQLGKHGGTHQDVLRLKVCYWLC